MAETKRLKALLEKSEAKAIVEKKKRMEAKYSIEDQIKVATSKVVEAF